MARKAAAAARDWALVLSELSAVSVALEWEAPAWRVRWTDGPTVALLSERAVGLARYRVGAPLGTDRLSFQRRTSPAGWALAWLRHGGPAPGQAVAEAFGAVEDLAAAWPYPERCDPAAIAAADLLARLAGDEPYHRMGQLLAEASRPGTALPAGPVITELPGRLQSLAWPRGGPPADLLGPTRPADDTPAVAATAPSAATPPAGRNETRNETSGPPRVCAQCGTPIRLVAATGRPARYCSTACRVRAHRQRTTTAR